MFESFLEKILSRVIGKYVEGIRKEDMKVGLLSGNVEIKNLKLKKQIIEELKLPFALKFGIVDKLNLKVPWKSLSSSAVVAELEGLYLLEYDMFQNRHATMVTFAQNMRDTLAEKLKMKGQQEQGYFAKVVQKIIDNLQISIKNIHIRIESEFAPVQNLSFGVTLDTLRVFTCDEHWKEAQFIDRTQRKDSRIHKKLILDNFRVYWNANESNFVSHLKDDVKAMRTHLKDLIYNEDNKDSPSLQSLNYLLEFSTEAQMVQNNLTQKLIDDECPEFDISISLNACQISLNKGQIKQLVDILNVINDYSSYHKAKEGKYKNFMLRPDRIIRLGETGEEKSEIAREYWKYAKRAIIGRRKEEKRGIQTVMVFSRKGESNIKRRFMKIFNHMLEAKDPLVVELDELDKRFYESVLLGMNADKIKTWIEERIKEKQFEEELKKKVASKKGYLNGWWGKTVSEEDITGDEKDEIKNFIEDIVQKTEVNLKIPNNYPKLSLSFTQKEFRINLEKRDAYTGELERVSLLTEEILLDVKLKQKGSAMKSSLKSFGVFYSKIYVGDKNAAPDVYEPILYSKTSMTSVAPEESQLILKNMVDEHRLLFYNNELCGKFLEKASAKNKGQSHFFSIADEDYRSMRHETGKQTFFTLIMEDSPMKYEGILDKRIEMNVGSVKVIFIKQAIDFLADMFRFENISSDITQRLKDQSKKTIRNAADITGEVYDNFLKDQKTISIHMQLQSPEIVLPINTEANKGPSLVFWPGNLTVMDGVTERLLKEERGEQVEKKGKRELYDSYNIRLDKMELEYCREFRMAKGDLFNKGLNGALTQEAGDIESEFGGGDHHHHDEFDENFSKKKRALNKLQKAQQYIARRTEMFDSMFRDFSIGVKIELLKNIFVQLECSDARKKVTAELSSLELEANPEIISELMKLTQMFVLNEGQKTRLALKRNMSDAIKMEHLEVTRKGAPDLNFVIATRTKLFFYQDIKLDVRPLETVDFEDLPDLVFDREGLRLVVKKGAKDQRVVKFAKREDFNKWELALSPIKKKLAIKRMKFEEEEKIRLKKLKLRQDDSGNKEKASVEVDKSHKDQLDFGGEIIDMEVHFRFTNFILVMNTGEKRFIILTKEMKVDLVKTTDGLDLEMSLLDFEVKREHHTEAVKFMITSDYFSSLSSRIFKENIVQKQRKLINISFKQKKDQPQEAQVYFGCLFITLEPRIIKEFVHCLATSLATPGAAKAESTANIELASKDATIDEIQLSPKIYQHLENSKEKLDDLSQAKKTISVEVTIENISLLLVSTVNETFIPLAQLMIEGGRVDCGVFAGAVQVDLKFKDLVCMDLTNYPSTLKRTDFENIRPMKLFGRLTEKEQCYEDANPMVDRDQITLENSLISVGFLMQDPLIFNTAKGVKSHLDVTIQNIHINLYLQAVLRILGFLTDQLLPSLSSEESAPAPETPETHQSQPKGVDNQQLYNSYIAIMKPLWMKMNIQINQTEVHMNMDSLFNERIRVYLGSMVLTNDKFQEAARILVVDDNPFAVNAVWVDRYSFRMKGLQILLEERTSPTKQYLSKELMQPFGMTVEIDLPMNGIDYDNLFDAQPICNPNGLYMQVPCKDRERPREAKPRLIYDTSMVLNTQLDPFIAIMGNIEYLAVMRALEENVLFNDLCDELFIVDYVKKEQARKPSGMFINLGLDNIGFVCLDNENNNLVDSKIYIDNMKLQLLMTPQGDMHLQMGMENLFGYYLVENQGHFYEKGFINDFSEANVYQDLERDELREEFIKNMKNSAQMFDRRTGQSFDTGTLISQSKSGPGRQGFEAISEKQQKFYLKLTGDTKSKDIQLSLRGLKILVETKSLLMLADLTAPKTPRDLNYAKIVSKRKWKQAEFMREIQKRNQKKKPEIQLKEQEGKLEINNLIAEQRKEEQTRMDVKVDIVNNFFYIPTSDLKSAMVATGNINVELHKKDTPVNWANDLSMRREIKILADSLAKSEKKKKARDKKQLVKQLKEGKIPSKAALAPVKEKAREVIYDIVWLSELEPGLRSAKLKKMTDEEKLVRMKQFETNLKGMELDLGLREFEIYLTDFQKIMEDNSKHYHKRMGMLNQGDSEEEVLEVKAKAKVSRKKNRAQDKSKQNKRNLLLPWTFELSFIEYGGYSEMDDFDVESLRMGKLQRKVLEPEGKGKKVEEKGKKEKKKEEKEEEEEPCVVDTVEGKGEVKFPIVRMRRGDVKKKAMMHSDKVIRGKLDQLVFDISLKDIQLLQKIYTFHFGVFSQHKEGKPKAPGTEKKAPSQEVESITANVVSNSSISFIVEKPVRISLVNDFENVFVRSLVIQLSKLEVNGDVERESKFFVGFQLKMMYYNSGLTSWEPVLEKLNMMVEYSQYQESIRKQINDILEEKMAEYDQEKSAELKKLKKKGKLTEVLLQNFQTGRAQTLGQLEKEQLGGSKLQAKSRTMIKIEQGIKMREFEGEEGIKVHNNDAEVMNFNVTIAFLEKVIFFQKVFQGINEEREQLQKDMDKKRTKLLEVKDFESSKARKTKLKGEGIVSPARVVNQSGYPIEVEYQKKQVRITEGTMNIEIKDQKNFQIANTDSFPLFWDNFEVENLFNQAELEGKVESEPRSTQMDTFFYKTISFRVRHPKFGLNWVKNLSLNDNFDRKLVTKGKQRILSDFRVLCNSRNIGDLKEITISSQVLIDNQLTARGCRRIINVETIHPFGRSIITIKPGQKKFVPFDLINFETRIYANKDRMIPQNFKFNNFILKERNYKVIFHSKDFSYNFILKVERDPKFFYLTRLVAVPAISFRNDMPFPCDLFLSNGVQEEVITLKQGEHVKKCNFNILKNVTFMAGILRPEVLAEEEKTGKRDRAQIIKAIKTNPFQRYYFKSKGKMILQNGHLGLDYKKILSLYNEKEERTYFSIVRWITPDSYFGFLLYSDSAVVNETPYRLHFRATDISQNKHVDPVPQMESLGLKSEPQSQVSFFSSKRTTLEIKLRDSEKNKMLFFSTKFSNKITTSGLVNGVFILNMQKQKGLWVQSERHIPRVAPCDGPNLFQSLAPAKPSERTIADSQLEQSDVSTDPLLADENFNEIFPSSTKIKTNKMYLEIGYKLALVYSQENKGALVTKVIHLCAKTIISNETEYLLVVQQKNSERIGLRPHSKKPVFAFVGENGKNKLFNVSLVDNDQVFSSQVAVDFNKGGSISLIMMSESRKLWKVVRVEMLIEDSYMFVKVSDRTGKRDMIIKNNIAEPIRIFQHKQREVFKQVLRPGEIKEMAWVDPYQDQKIRVEILEEVGMDRRPSEAGQETKRGGQSAVNKMSLDDLQFEVVDELEIEIQNLKKAEVKTKRNRHLTVDIKLVHHSRMIEIETESKYKEEKHLEELHGKPTGTNVFTCLIKIAKMGVSLVAKTNRVRRELFYLYINETNFFYEKEGPSTSLQFQIRYLNIDNNYSSQCRFPVLFTCGRSLSEMTMKNQYMVNCILKMLEVESDPDAEAEAEQKIMCFDEITLELSPLTMTFEWSIINTMSEFMEQLNEIKTGSTVARSYLSKYFLSPQQLALENSPDFALASEWEGKNIESSVWIYCSKLNISCLKFVVTFNMNKDESGELSKSEDSYFNVMVNTLGGTLLNIDESPLSFNGIKLFYVFESSNGLISLYKQHLLDQAKLNVMRLLGSFDILGNPTNLFGNVGDGVVQFFEKPVEGFKKGPISGIKGIASGSTALLKNTAAGTLNAISKFTGSLASGLTILSNDKTYQRQRNLKKAKKPKGVLEGLESGAQSIGKGVWSGVTGIVTQPIKEVKKSGAIGIFKGIFKGITGVITKPLGGILDATSQTTEGIKKTITKNDDKANEFKQRPPRVFYTDKNVIKVYDNEHAKRIKALVKVDSNLENESLIDSVQLSLQFKKEKKKCILVITNNYFVILNENLSKIHITCEIMDVKKVEFKLDLDLNGKPLDTGKISIKYMVNHKEHDFEIVAKRKKITRIMQSIYYTRYIIYLQKC